MKSLLRCFIVACTVIAASCARHSGEPQEVAPVYAWFEDYTPGAAVPDRLRPGMAAFMKVMGVDSVGDDALRAWAVSQPVRVFSPDVDSVFPSLGPVEAGLGAVLGAAREENLRLPRRSYAAVVWGRPESIVFCDSVVLVALNHYLGAGYPGYSHLPQYRREAKEPARLPVDIAEALVATQYPYEGGVDATVLSRLLYEGALNEARLRLAGCSEAAALGYSEVDYRALLEHEEQLWQALVAGRLLYSTLPVDAERLVDPAPSTPLLSAMAPGRAGRFLGWRIVQAYLKRYPDTSLPELLSPSFYNSESTLRASSYVGRS